MKKEITIKIVIDGDTIGSIISKSGFVDDISSKFEIIGILNRLIAEEQKKLDDKLKVHQNYIFKETLNNDDEDAI